MSRDNRSWIGVDLDGTLAHYQSGQFPLIGKPIPETVAIVKRLHAAGKRVKIYSARANDVVRELDKYTHLNHEMLGIWKIDNEQCKLIRAWCTENLGFELEITNCKDFDMEFAIDDRAIAVEYNTGKLFPFDPKWRPHVGME